LKVLCAGKFFLSSPEREGFKELGFKSSSFIKTFLGALGGLVVKSINRKEAKSAKRETSSFMALKCIIWRKETSPCESSVVWPVAMFPLLKERELKGLVLNQKALLKPSLVHLVTWW
jgi:hypothetical protein